MYERNNRLQIGLHIFLHSKKKEKEKLNWIVSRLV